LGRISTTWMGEITLDTHEGCVECPAEFDIEGEEFDAEPYSWGQSRGKEIEVKAELLWARFGDLKLDRDMVEKITGKAHLELQEEGIADDYSNAHEAGDIAA